MDKAFDVAIVGGGLVGAAIGYGLAGRGLTTVILDEGDDALRTARGNFGLVWVQGKGEGMTGYARWSLQASRDWPEFAARLESETGIDVAYDRPGGFTVCLDHEEFTAQQDTMRRLSKEAGIAYEARVGTELRDALPTIGETVAGATYCPHDGHCNPLRLLRALHQAFQQHGGRYIPRSRVEKIRFTPQGENELRCENHDQPIFADKLVLAAGHGTRALADQVGLSAPIYPEQGQVIVTERVRPTMPYPTSCVRQTDEGNFLLGASNRDVGFHTGIDFETLKKIARRCVAAFPPLRDLRVQRTWAALRIMTPDGCPIYQQSADHPGVFSFSCHSGVTLASVHALEVPAWIVNGHIPEKHGCFHPDRFDVSAHISHH